MSDTSVGIGTKKPHKARERVSMVRFAQDLLRSEPEVFSPYEPSTVWEAMKEAGLPQTAIDDVGIFWLQMHRKDLDPNYQPRPKSTSKLRERRDARKAAAAERKAIIAEVVAEELQIAAYTMEPDMIMQDGRRLGDWTIADLRKLNGLFAFILDKAGTRDDTRTVDQVMKARDWKRATKEGA